MSGFKYSVDPGTPATLKVVILIYQSIQWTVNCRENVIKIQPLNAEADLFLADLEEAQETWKQKYAQATTAG